MEYYKVKVVYRSGENAFYLVYSHSSYAAVSSVDAFERELYDHFKSTPELNAGSVEEITANKHNIDKDEFKSIGVANEKREFKEFNGTRIYTRIEI